eukprot:c1894_g1_i1.p1 GENE.c1894_g1_i1~~c1894_g1_i1.p1  ORF type:complete len:204 (+),score=21.31 c1894_g1_i1:38-613(+)
MRVFEVLLVTANNTSELESIKTLFREYQMFLDSVGCDICFQDFEKELATLPGKFAAEMGGVLLLLRETTQNVQNNSTTPNQAVKIGSIEREGTTTTEGDVGCIALRDLGDGVGEIKRLFVRKEWQGLALGLELSRVLISLARGLPYHTLRLDTLERLQSACQLYPKLGFVRTEPYCFNPFEDAVFMELKLQ